MSWRSLSKYRSELMGFACLWVMLHHNPFDWPRALGLLESFARYGNLGVDIFLLLSGVGLCFAWQKTPKLSTFYARRLVRVLVPYALIAVPYWVWRDLWLGGGDFWLDVTQLSLPLRGVITTWYIPAITVFYLLYPLIARVIFSGEPKTRCVYLCGVVMLLCLHLNYSGSEIYRNCEIALTRTVIFIIGCMLGKFVREDKPMEDCLVPLSLLCLMLNSSLRRHVSPGDVWIRFSYIPLALAVTVLLLWLLQKLDGAVRLRRFLRFFGERSLELYLSHVLLRSVFYLYYPADLWDPWGIGTYALILTVSLVLSSLLHPVINKFCGALLRLTGKESV